MKERKTEKKPILVSGATGYVGGRLIPLLLEKGYRVRAMGRSVDKMACRAWAAHPNAELVQGDVTDRNSLLRACEGCTAAYYLVHSMIARKKHYAAADRIAARNMLAAAEVGGVERIIYLGGLGDVREKNISAHLLSRHEVGEILSSGKIPLTVLNAAMILGSGSASFEILRYLTERLPLMITPRWVQTPTQPIAISDVLSYLVGCLEHGETAGQTYDIGGADILNYGDLIRMYAEEAGLAPRKIIPVPFLTPYFSALWIHLITPVPASIAVPLTEGLAVPTTCRENRIRQIIPFKPAGCRAAIRKALDKILEEQVESCWADAGKIQAPEWAYCGDAQWAGGTILECGYRVRIAADAEEVWEPVSRIGGKQGYYFGNLLWQIRGLADRLAGGAGLRRGRRHPSELYMGDALDFWRVLEVRKAESLVLKAEMKMPGEALLDIRIRSAGKNSTELQLLSRFLPRGLAGMLYWYILYPFHQWIFFGMLKNIAQSTRKKILSEPERFTVKIPDTCSLRPE
ncbi:MAG: SDR family oxidoreductase [Desulfococcaceae bacterium]|nr:SDR family oxidoreductase [Desulfococcaceae bacterium]